jgi:MYXO-CTERM domain-containing protein
MAFTLIGTDLRFSTNHPDWHEHWRGTDVITPAEWHRIAMHVVWSTDPAVGIVDVWLDGEQVVLAAHAATLVDGNPAFVQLGLLRGAIEFGDRPVIFVDDAVEGDSLESVRPDALSMRPDAGVAEDAGVALDAPFDAPSGADAGAASAPSGCSCRAERARPIPSLAALALFGALLTHRRQRRRKAQVATLSKSAPPMRHIGPQPRDTTVA